MLVRVFCEECNKYEEIEVLVQESPSNAEADNYGIPAPSSSRGGLETYSIVHGDHTLVVQVDANGAVRRQQVIKRVDIGLETALTAVVTIIMEELAMSERSHGVFFIGADRNISRLLLSVVNTLLMNITEGVQAWVEVESSTLRFSYGSFSLYWGQWLPDLRAAQTDVNTVVFTLTPDNVGQKLPEFRSQQEPEQVGSSNRY